MTAAVDSAPAAKMPIADDGVSVLEERALHLPDQEREIRLGEVQAGCGDAVMLDIGRDMLVMRGLVGERIDEKLVLTQRLKWAHGAPSEQSPR